jgi:hypothetical protein
MESSLLGKCTSDSSSNSGIPSTEGEQVRDIFSGIKRDAFWTVETGDEMIGTFRIESRSNANMEHRRMWAIVAAALRNVCCNARCGHVSLVREADPDHRAQCSDRFEDFSYARQKNRRPGSVSMTRPKRFSITAS